MAAGFLYWKRLVGSGVRYDTNILSCPRETPCILPGIAGTARGHPDNDAGFLLLQDAHG